MVENGERKTTIMIARNVKYSEEADNDKKQI